MASEWYVLIGDNEKGPFESARLKKLVADGHLTREMQVKKGAEGDWVHAGRIDGLFKGNTPTHSARSIPALGGSDRYYKPSGVVPAKGLVLVPLGGLVASLVLSAIYGVIEAINPFIYITLLATLGLGLGVAVAVNLLSTMGGVRNKGFNMICGVGLGLASVYFSWVFYIWAYKEFDIQQLSFNPLEVLRFLSFAGEEGLWSMGRLTPTGIMLYSVWLVEAAIIVVLPTAATFGSVDPYCEDCDCWAEEQEEVWTLPADAAAGISRDLEAEKYQVLFDHVDEIVDSDDYLAIDLFCCPSCDDSNYLKVRQLETTYDKDGDPSVEDETIVEPIRVPTQLVAELLKSGEASEVPAR